MRSRAEIDSYIGKRYSRLLIISISKYDKGRHKYPMYCAKCVCDCGNIRDYELYNLIKLKGNAKSCGCLRIENGHKSLTTHGLSRLLLYKVWDSMKQRCTNPNDTGYKNYGGRGISICNEWLHNPEIFIKWALNNGYKKGLVIDREKNNGNYTPNNCRFITNKLSQRNTRRNKICTYRNLKKPLCEWMEILDLDYNLICQRLRRGWDFKEAVETKTRNYIKLHQ